MRIALNVPGQWTADIASMQTSACTLPATTHSHPRHVSAFLSPACTIGLLSGIGMCLLLPTLPGRIWLMCLLVVGAAIWLVPHRHRHAGALLTGFAWAGLQASGILQSQLPPALELQVVQVSGQVIGLPQHEARRTRFVLQLDGSVTQPGLRGKRVQLAWYDDYGSAVAGPRMQLHAGEHWRMQVKLRAPRGLRNPGGFDSERHLLAQRIAAMGHVRDPESAQRIVPAHGVDAWRERMSMRMASRIPVASSRFVRALALGDTNGLSDEDWEWLRACGLTHLIAISGFHVGIVAGFFALLAKAVWWVCPSLARRWPRVEAAGVAAMIGACGYTWLAGMALPTLRTSLMIAVLVCIRIWRRSVRVVDALALSAALMLLFDPLSPLLAGFWLSFVGVAWLLWCLPDGDTHVLRDFANVQAVATLGLLPLTVVLFGMASLAGPLANAIAVPWWSLVVVPLSLLGTALDVIHQGAGEWVWRASAWCFDATWPLFQRMAQSPHAMWWLPQARGMALPLALFGAFWWMLPRGVPGKSLAMLLWLPLLWPDRQLPRTGEAEIVLVDVGQGLSVLVRTAHHDLLYDMGPAVQDGFDAGERAVVPTLRALGVRRLDAAIVSHGDNDHAGGFDAVRRAFPMPLALSPPDSPVRDVRACIAGMQWSWDGVRFRILHPHADFPYLKNESSCVLRIDTAHGSVLLTGDIGEIIERRLVAQYGIGLRSDVLVVAHHGSRFSSTPEFIAATRPRWAVVSSGYGNRFRHPYPQTIAHWRAAGAQWLDTAQGGAIRMRIGHDGIHALTERADHATLWDAARRQARTTRGSGLSYRLD